MRTLQPHNMSTAVFLGCCYHCRLDGGAGGAATHSLQLPACFSARGSCRGPTGNHRAVLLPLTARLFRRVIPDFSTGPVRYRTQLLPFALGGSCESWLPLALSPSRQALQRRLQAVGPPGAACANLPPRTNAVPCSLLSCLMSSDVILRLLQESKGRSQPARPRGQAGSQPCCLGLPPCSSSCWLSWQSLISGMLVRLAGRALGLPTAPTSAPAAAVDHASGCRNLLLHAMIDCRSSSKYVNRAASRQPCIARCCASGGTRQWRAAAAARACPSAGCRRGHIAAWHDHRNAGGSE
jgi:hypothetical protein